MSLIVGAHGGDMYQLEQCGEIVFEARQRARKISSIFEHIPKLFIMNEYTSQPQTIDRFIQRQVGLCRTLFRRSSFLRNVSFPRYCCTRMSGS